MRISAFHIVCFLALGIGLLSCRAKDDYPGVEFSPNMYHSVPYEPLKQITDKGAGQLVSTRPDGLGEFYTTNPNNPYNMNMRRPADHTVRRTDNKVLPYRVPKDSLEYAAKHVTSPIDLSDEAVLEEGEMLYVKYCQHCHGENGQGSQGETALVGQAFKGVPSYSAGRVSDVSEGHIFHVITHGKGRMGAHASQVGIEERWKIVSYVKQLQNQ